MPSRKQDIVKLSKAYQGKHLANIQRVIDEIMALMEKGATRAAYLAAKGKLINNRFLPIDVRNAIERIITVFHEDASKVIINGIARARRIAEEKNNLIAKGYMGGGNKPPTTSTQISGSSRGGRRGGGRKPPAPPRNTVADSFDNRFTPRSLSPRVWKLSNSYKATIKKTLVEGLRKGTGAKALAREMKRNLRNAQGSETPGQGVYRSPRKNAERLTRTEINMAFEHEDFKRWQELWFVVGIEVRLSAAHPKFDVCFTNPNVKVMTSKGHKRICDIIVGDLVLTHTGKYQRVLRTFRNHSKEENVTKISGKFSYDSRGKTHHITATDNHPFLVNGQWIPISDIQPGDQCMMLANECKKCGKLIPYTREYCSKSCASWNTATNQHKDPSHTEKLRSKRYKLISDNGGLIPWFVEHIKSGKHKLNLKRTTENIAKQKVGMAKIVASGRHPFQQKDTHIKANRELAKNKFSTHIEKKIEWLLNEKGLKHTRQYAFTRDEKRANGQNRLFFIDFVIDEHNIAIEVDGEFWHQDKEKDAQRQGEIESKGFRVLRFTGDQVKNRLHECSEEIDRILMNHNEEYKFMPFKIETVEKKVLRQPVITKYNLEVENDNSYIVNGFVVHNCDNMVGIYPKDFLFPGFHPQCLCIAVPVMAPQEVRDQMLDYDLGLIEEKPEVKYITELPGNAKEWIQKNAERIKGWKNTPYFMTMNEKYTGSFLEN